MSTGILDHLIKTCPDPVVTVACGPLAAPLFEAMPERERTIVMAKQKGGGHWINLWRSTVTQKWDIVVDLRASATSWFLWAGTRYVKRNKPDPSDGPIHKVIENARVLGLTDAPDPTLWLSQTALDRAASAIPKDQSVIGIAPAAAAPFKEWPRDRFGQLIDRLDQHDTLKNARIVVFGGPGDKPASQEAIAHLDSMRVIDLTGALSIDEAAACMGQLDLFVGNDSGLMHLAAAAGTPTLGLFGPTDQRVYGPWGQQARSVRAGGEADEKERGRLRFAEDSMMGDLQVETVLQAVIALLEETRSYE